MKNRVKVNTEVYTTELSKKIRRAKNKKNKEPLITKREALKTEA